MPFFHYSRALDRASPISAEEADRDWRHTDVNDDEFIVKAYSLKDAENIARKWIVVRADDDCNDMGDLAIEERPSRRSDCRAYTIITEL